MVLSVRVIWNSYLFSGFIPRIYLSEMQAKRLITFGVTVDTLIVLYAKHSNSWALHVKSISALLCNEQRAKFMTEVFVDVAIYG